jgi:hypothetical protein
MYKGLSFAYFWGTYFGYREQAVAQLVEELRYKPEGRGFDWNFSFT